ncbi:hypothetical protein ALC60_00792 [Trachymyrmex zeteki]|uniref:Uncharacterized protein n=1 Tax=Mycetomoellerius zeteki TaxID=64791 RepID=A0A151XJ12_9HYME|nr:hypothetical protein ALC60_00792 [Trachymyrmex zeteki]
MLNFRCSSFPSYCHYRRRCRHHQRYHYHYHHYHHHHHLENLFGPEPPTPRAVVNHAHGRFLALRHCASLIANRT